MTRDHDAGPGDPDPSAAPRAAGPEVAVGAAVLRDARLLVVQRGRAPSAGRWTLPGGRVRRGERLRDAVVREVAEETALEVEVDRLLGWTEHLDADHHYVILDFAAHLRSAADPVAGDDAADVAWMTRTELRAAGPTDGLLEFLEEHGVHLAP